MSSRITAALLTLFLMSSMATADETAEKAPDFSAVMERVYEITKAIDPSLWEIANQWKEHFRTEQLKGERKTPVFFYFFTMGKPKEGAEKSLSYFNAAAAKLKRFHPDVRFYGVMRGLPEDTQRMAALFKQEAKAGNATAAGVRVKFFPGLFEELNITSAPAYAFGMCKQEFGEKDGCDFYYLARGNIGLDGFIELFESSDPYFKGWPSQIRSAE